MKYKDMPKQELPREKAFSDGIQALSNIELLCILLRSGTKDKNVYNLSAEVLKALTASVDLNDISVSELTKIKGVGLAKATTIVASIELVKRLLSKQIVRQSLPSPSTIFQHFKPLFYDVKQEHLYSIYIDQNGKVLSKKLISMGTSTKTIVDEKKIFMWAYKYNAQGIILVHNHPNGNSEPSDADIAVTKNIADKAKSLDFVLLDHIIIGNDYFSFKMNYNFF